MKDPKELLVITGASVVKGTLPLYLKQLDEAEIPWHFVQSLYYKPVGDLEAKISWVRKQAEYFSDYRYLIFSDAWDVTFYGTKRQVVDKIPDTGILWAADKGCFPDTSVAGKIAQRNTYTPWRYSNGGLVAGTPKSFLFWCEQTESYSLYPEYKHEVDQKYLNHILAYHPTVCNIDYRTKLFYCFNGGTDGLDVVNGLPVNKLCGTSPNFIHAQGGFDPSEFFASLERQTPRSATCRSLGLLVPGETNYIGVV